jgi:predicted tellurium resistance membrane protein TerC
MESLFTADNLVSLFTLAILEIILGVDNVIFVSIIMGRLHPDKQLNARRMWMITGIAVRVFLLFCLSWLIAQKGKALFTMFGKGFDLASLVMIAGGLFLLYKTVKEIHHKLEGDEEAKEAITAVGMAKNLWVMIIAVVIAMVVMFLFSKRISDFIHKHPTLKMLALSFLVLVGVILLIEGWNAEKAHELHLKNYVYFAMAFSFGVEMLNMRLRKKAKPVELHSPVLKSGEKRL